MLSKNKSQKLNLIMTISLYGYCLSAGLSIAASQIFVCLNILIYLLFFIRYDAIDAELKQIQRAGILFFYACILCSVLGLDFSHSWKEVMKIGFYFIFPFSVMKTVKNNPSLKIQNVLITLLFSQSLAAIHSLLENSLNLLSLPKIPGAVTESGQLVLTIPLAFGLFYTKSCQQDNLKLIFIFISYMLATYLEPLAIIPILAILLYETFKFVKNKNITIYLPLILALLLGTLTINLKRGPWMGVLFEFLLIGVFVSRKFILYSILSSILFLFIGPVRDRLAALSDHFLIYGGRYSMWKLGLDIFARYPLGIGVNNSDYMRIFDPSLPKTHRHMHNNLLNIAVEMGVLGLASYLYIFYSIFLLAKKTYQKHNEENRLLTLCIALSLFGWQIAGLVEYNFGDSEIRLIALLLLGLIFTLSTSDTSNELSEQQ